MMKAQSAVMDGLFFVLVCGAASTLLFYTSGLYGASTSRQIATVYNYEYAGTALVSLHYAKAEGKWFWIEIKEKLSKPNPRSEMQSYLNGDAKKVWNSITSSSPSRMPVLYFKGAGEFYCFERTSGQVECGGLPDEYENRTVFASSVKVIDKHPTQRAWEIILQLYY